MYNKSKINWFEIILFTVTIILLFILLIGLR